MAMAGAAALKDHNQSSFDAFLLRMDQQFEWLRKKLDPKGDLPYPLDLNHKGLLRTPVGAAVREEATHVVATGTGGVELPKKCDFHQSDASDLTTVDPKSTTVSSPFKSKAPNPEFPQITGDNVESSAMVTGLKPDLQIKMEAYLEYKDNILIDVRKAQQEEIGDGGAKLTVSFAGELLQNTDELKSMVLKNVDVGSLKKMEKEKVVVLVITNFFFLMVFDPGGQQAERIMPHQSLRTRIFEREGIVRKGKHWD